MRFRTHELVRMAGMVFGRVIGPPVTRKRTSRGAVTGWVRVWPVELMTGDARYVPENEMTSAEGRNTNEEK